MTKTCPQCMTINLDDSPSCEVCYAPMAEGHEAQHAFDEDLWRDHEEPAPRATGTITWLLRLAGLIYLLPLGVLALASWDAVFGTPRVALMTLTFAVGPSVFIVVMAQLASRAPLVCSLLSLGALIAVYCAVYLATARLAPLGLADHAAVGLIGTALVLAYRESTYRRTCQAFQ